ncbi:armadillo repeat-containing protein 2 isoform X3 [Myiozetetes cayanensis]|uniref:armadillo repeat-containing protein 2 isoform X3 n=1 Tax=Myiozetetes cayanensis TaxID=478635 RepID=UPI00215DD694|nr:armadillo repeat-containing protein 2 isoform X3 [Myiozetetes cayanensis]
MQASKTENTKKAEPFYWLSVAKQKTSSEIINEARNVLRAVGTRRPFTPTDDQRKLFGFGSSRGPQSRPPSVFSLHASSFDLAESRPVSGVRLSPLDHKPILITSAKDEDSSFLLPKPPAGAAEVRRVSSARACLCRTTSLGNLFSAKVVLPDQNKEKLDSEEPAMMMNNLARSKNNYLAEQRSYTPVNDESRQLICNERISRSESEDFMEGTSGKFSLQLRGERGVNSDGRFADEEQQFPCNQMREPGINSSWPKSSGWKRRVAGLEDETRINECEEEEVFWRIKILPILHELKKKDNIENLCLACTKLYQALTEGNMLGKQFKRRSELLKTLYKLVDIDSDPLCLKLAKIILAMKVDGKNLLSVCKLAFKICRNEKNDYIVQNDRLLDCLLEVLRNEDLQKNNEAFLYCMGAIKFMSGNAVLLNEMVNKGAVEMLLQLMKQINNIKENDTYFSELGHVLVQLTATLRNLADLPPARCQLICGGAASELCVALEQRVKDQDVCTYIVRILSKLSSYNDFCAALADCSRCYILFLALLNKHQKQQNTSPSMTVKSWSSMLPQQSAICPTTEWRVLWFKTRSCTLLKNRDVCFSACGVLLNLTVDKNKRAFLMEEGGIGKLVDCLQDFGPADWQLSCLICKTLWNYSENFTSAASCFGEDTDTLLVLLTSLLDENLALDCSLDREGRDSHKLHWEREFKPVAEKLLDRIQSHHSFLPAVPITPF